MMEFGAESRIAVLQLFLAFIDLIMFLYYCSPIPKRDNFKISNLITVFAAIAILFFEQCCQLNIYYDLIFRCGILYAVYNIKFKSSFKDGLYIVITFYITMDISRALLSNSFLEVVGISINKFRCGIYLYAAVLTVIKFTALKIIKRYVYKNSREDLSLKKLILIILPLIPFLFIRSFHYKTSMIMPSLNKEIVIAQLFLCIFDFAIIICFEMLLSGEINKNKMATMEMLLNKEQEQYFEKMDKIDSINKICHDMKKHINYIKAINDNKEIDEYIGKLYSDLNTYSIIENTGNRTLDIILNEKISICRENNIRLINYVKADSMKFMSPADICTLIGNGLENAIDALIKVDEADKREIVFKVNDINNYLTIYIENYYNDNLKKDRNGNLKTTKEDDVFHGYGIKNMKAIVMKYNGYLDISTEESVFKIKIVIKIP